MDFEEISTPYHITFAGSLLSIVEASSDFFLYEFYMESSPVTVSETAWMFSSAMGLVIALGIAGFLYYKHRHESLQKDSFLLIVIASLTGFILGGQLTAIITLIGAIICYRRL